MWEATSDSQNDIESDKIGWMQTNGPYGGTITALHATPEGILFAGTQEVGIFRSMDGSETWTPASEGLRVSPDDILPNILVLTQEGNTLYAGTNGGLFYSSNGGDSWQQLTHFQDAWGISGVAIIGDTLYIGRYAQESVFFSNDNGKSWTQIDSGLTGRGSPSCLQVEQRFSHKCGITFSASELARIHGQNSPLRIRGKKPSLSQILQGLWSLAKLSTQQQPMVTFSAQRIWAIGGYQSSPKRCSISMANWRCWETRSSTSAQALPMVGCFVQPMPVTHGRCLTPA